MYFFVLLIRRRCGISRPRRVLFGSLCISKLLRTFPDDRDKQTSAKETQPKTTSFMNCVHELSNWIAKCVHQTTPSALPSSPYLTSCEKKWNSSRLLASVKRILFLLQHYETYIGLNIVSTKWLLRNTAHTFFLRFASKNFAQRASRFQRKENLNVAERRHETVGKVRERHQNSRTMPNVSF